MTNSNLAFPKIVSQEEWLAEHKQLLAKEKEATRALDALAAERRRQPMVRIDKGYVFEGKDGSASLLDLFDGRRQLIVYHFMFDPGWKAGCVGCSMLVDGMGHPAHLQARDTSLVLVSRAPLEGIEPFKKRMGWNIPWFSSFGSDFNYDFGATTDKGEVSCLSVFLRDGENVFRTYFTSARGSDRLNASFNYLDLTPLGRQEDWEDSPEGWPQSPPYKWWRRHDEYEHSKGSDSCCNS
ncbi:DUF899 domain-containing protein [Paenibacillus sp. sptzw28]|nr:DUF899 domain-containing protein [Paenibacillus sp. sptzw28]QYR22524.1 DUF899 domain-containing protein [Paenibacillus sp. sptzw28]